MTSNTTIKKRRTKIKVSRGGQQRKAKDRNQGSTPAFPVKPEEESPEQQTRFNEFMRRR